MVVPTDVVGQVVSKLLGNRAPEEFIPQIVTPGIVRSCEDLAQEHGRQCSLDGVVKEFIPADPLNMIGNLQTDVVGFVVGLTPKSVIVDRSLMQPYKPVGLLRSVDEIKASFDTARANAPMSPPKMDLPKPPELFKW